MNTIDYSKVFRTREELADFALLDPDEQDAALVRMAEEGRNGLELVCELRLKKPAP